VGRTELTRRACCAELPLPLPDIEEPEVEPVLDPVAEPVDPPAVLPVEPVPLPVPVLPAVVPVPEVPAPALVEPLPDELPPLPLAIEPVTSTRCPTYCCRFWLSPPMRRYVDPPDALLEVEPAPVAPVVPVALPAAPVLLPVEPPAIEPDDDACVRMKPPPRCDPLPEELAVLPVLEVLPVGLLPDAPLADWRHPVRVIWPAL
jgi:hypothetical protein